MNSELEDFFKELRSSDERVPVPPLESLLPQKKALPLRRYLPISIAASLLLFAAVLFNVNKRTDSTTEKEVLITLEMQNLKSETLLSEDSSIYDWESPSAFLVNDFND